MKKLIFVITLLISFCVQAQESVPQKYLLTTVSDKGGISIASLIDPYLSPLTYSGPGIFYERSSQKLFSAENPRILHETKIGVSINLTSNPANTAHISHAEGTVSWGSYYHFNIINQLRIRLGAFFDASASNNNHTRNVNNPINFDVNANLNAAAELKYKFRIFKKNMNIYSSFDFPFSGIMFVPQSGKSYYQIVELKDFSKTIHYSSLHNRQGLNVNAAFEIPFKHSTWKFGAGAENLTWKANDMIFKHNEFKLSVAIKYNIRRFSGTKNTAPENFISVESD